MATEVRSRLWRRRYVVDDAGIAEFRWDGLPLRRIPWEQLARIEVTSLRSASGERIKPRLYDDQWRAIRAAVSAGWRARSPEAWREDFVRRARLDRRLRFVWMPLFLAANSILCYALWTRGVVKSNQLAFMLIVSAWAIAWFWFEYFAWVHYEKAAALSRPPDPE